ncbi:MAG: hypothetical protein ABIH92_01675 [Nanoarchaeota archaeon]
MVKKIKVRELKPKFKVIRELDKVRMNDSRQLSKDDFADASVGMSSVSELGSGFKAKTLEASPQRVRQSEATTAFSEARQEVHSAPQERRVASYEQAQMSDVDVSRRALARSATSSHGLQQKPPVFSQEGMTRIEKEFRETDSAGVERKYETKEKKRERGRPWT